MTAGARAGDGQRVPGAVRHGHRGGGRDAQLLPARLRPARVRLQRAGDAGPRRALPHRQRLAGTFDRELNWIE